MAATRRRRCESVRAVAIQPGYLRPFGDVAVDETRIAALSCRSARADLAAASPSSGLISAKRSAVARPMPVQAPVMTAATFQ